MYYKCTINGVLNRHHQYTIISPNRLYTTEKQRSNADRYFLLEQIQVPFFQ